MEKPQREHELEQLATRLREALADMRGDDPADSAEIRPIDELGWMRGRDGGWFPLVDWGDRCG